MGNCLSGDSQEPVSTVGINRQSGNDQASRGSMFRAHRKQQAARQQSSTSHLKSGQSSQETSKQIQDHESPSKKPRGAGPMGHPGYQPHPSHPVSYDDPCEGSPLGQPGYRSLPQPHPSHPVSYDERLLERREQQPRNTIPSGQKQLSLTQRQIDDLQRQQQNLRDRYEARIEDLEQQLRTRKKDYGDLWDRNEKEKRQYEQEGAQMKRQIEDLQRQLQKSQQDSRNSRDRHEVERTVLENKRLQEEIEKLQWEIKNLKMKNQDLLTRISSMASERMRSNNPCVEDLSDPNRHSAVLARWQALMNGEYWTLYEVALKGLPSEKYTAQFLLRIMELAFKEAQHLENGSAAFIDLMRNQRQAQGDPSMAALLDLLMRNEKFQEIVDSESRKVRKGGNATLPPTAFQDLHKKIQKESRNVASDLLEKSHKFADEVLRLCFLMALQSPPMALVFDRPEGKEMDVLLYEPDGDRNRRRPWIVNFVLTPPLLRYEGGPVLLKGSVELQ